MKEVPETKLKLTEIKEMLAAGYTLLGNLREEVQAPVVKAKFFNKELIAIYGKEAAKTFYDPKNFKREGAMPKIVLKTLFGEGGVQTLDGKEHQQRKSYFMYLMSPQRMADYHDILERNLSAALAAQHGTFELFDLAKGVFFTSICEWSGINLNQFSAAEIDELANYQISMISATSPSVVSQFQGVENRKKSEQWAQRLIEAARKNPVPELSDRALYTFAQAQTPNGDLLPLETAAVELLNIIRPTVALTVWAALMGHALFSRDDLYQQLKNDFSRLQDSFIQEMRRYYPFFPMLPAIAIRGVEVDGYAIPKGSWVVLDLYGTDHDPRLYNEPQNFIIDRFVGRTKELSYEEEYEMIAQGGGDFRSMHRCAGEWITLHSLRVFSDQLVNHFTFSVPQQDWEVPLNQFPTFPKSKALLYKE
ncbi:cytochrome P450 [Enterococcus faecalis]